MATEPLVQKSPSEPSRGSIPPGDPCILVIFGASGDLTKRLLMPALLNLASDGILPRRFGLIGVARSEMTSEQFRERMTTDIKSFTTRTPFDSKTWDWLVSRLHYTEGTYEDPATYQRLAALFKKLDGDYNAEGNLFIYLATPPSLFGTISEKVFEAGIMKREKGWTRLIVEKPFGHDLASAVELNSSMKKHWKEEQLYRVDHYLGKETVQNILAFRFSNGIFEPIWNQAHIDHIQITVSETVGVEGRGGYYDRTGVLRDMIQNHMFQMLAYLCMEPPSSFKPDAIRNEKVKVLESIRIMKPEDVLRNTVRGQYGPGAKPDGTPVPGYRQEPGVDPKSSTETFAAVRLFVDNWRWEGVPIYLRSGKALWKRGTEIIIQFHKAPDVIFRDTPSETLESNRLIFHIQPDQGIEFRFHAKTPGPTMSLQPVNMRFDYKEAFEAQRGTGYEVMFYSCMIGDATLFSRTDLVETAWQIAQPILDVWASMAPEDFPNYPAGSWGPKAAYDLLARDGRQWVEVINRGMLEQVPIFHGGNPVFLQHLALTLKPVAFAPGDLVIKKGDVGNEMYFVCRGEVEILDGGGAKLNTLGPGDFFGELSLLFSTPRTASVRATTPCDLFVLNKAEFVQLLKDYPTVAASIQEVARARYGKAGELNG
jgi:glucose-6-phosphate 1-dehydrogenase